MNNISTSKPAEYPAESGRLDPVIHTLNMLADELATNYCTASFGQEEKGKVKLNNLFIEPSTNKTYPLSTNVGETELKHRNILVIGTGASHDLYNCIPLGSELIRELYAKDKTLSEAVIKKRLDIIREEFKLEKQKPDFENTLSLMTQIYYRPQELTALLTEFVDFRYPPSLFYEIVAHMFKHSFIDVIINFNFDEMLDNAIDEELGKENYFHVISDGDCVPIEDIMIDGRLKIPVYIKPHGTFKHKSSLRFTNRHYLDMPDQIKKILEDLIGGNCGLKTPIRANLICVGFDMGSIEFNDILNKKLHKGSKIYHVMWEKEDEATPPFIENLLPEFFKREYEFKYNVQYDTEEPTDFKAKKMKLNSGLYHRIPLESLLPGKGNGINTLLSEMFSYIWRRVYHQFKDGFVPRSIGQHEIISYLFYNPDYSIGHKLTKDEPLYNKELVLTRKQLNEQYERNAAYFLDRTIVEIAIAINRNNGIVELAQLLGDRVGKYFTLYKTAHFNKYKNKKPAYSIYQLIDQFKSKHQSENYEGFHPKGVFELDTMILKDLTPDEELLNKIKDKKSAMDNCGNLKSWNTNKNDYQLVKILLEKFKKISSRELYKKGSGRGDFNPITPIVLYRLFTSEHLSKMFIDNFKRNYKKIIYNGKKYEEDETNRMDIKLSAGQPGPEMIDELIRLFDKSGVSSASYFSIHPKFNDPKNFLLESFTKSQILHTNLALDYKFRELFLKKVKGKEAGTWDLLLIIAEKTSLLGFLKEEGKEEKHDFDSKQIIIINSYESIKQFHPGIDEIYPKSPDPHKNENKKKKNPTKKEVERSAFRAKINELNSKQTLKYKEIVENYTLNPNNITIDVECLPAMQHNHHMMVFIKKSEENHNSSLPHYVVEDDGKKCQLNMVGALYMYRQGFSNSINPVFIGERKDGKHKKAVSNDFRRLLRIFSKLHRRAELFKDLPESEDLDTDFENEMKNIIFPKKANC
jgi:hypothetical protein